MAQSSGKKRIQQAFLDLLKTEPYSSITVKEITAAAGISRTSFYRHYETREDVSCDLIDSVLAEVDALRLKLAAVPQTDDFGKRALIYQMLQRIEEHKDALQQMMGDPGTAYQLISRSQRYLLDVTMSDAPEMADSGNEKWQARVRHYHAAGILAVVTDWISYGCSDSITEIVNFTMEASASSGLRFIAEKAAKA